MMLSWSAPMLSQLAMLIVIFVQRQWLYAAMFVPALLGSSLSFVALAMRSRNASDTSGHENSGSKDDSASSHGEAAPSIVFETIPRVSFEQLNHFDDDALVWRSVIRSWLRHGSPNAIGAESRHKAFSVDLARCGPHAMVAGTTGSGKSELLISWCLALASRHNPDELHFVFLDFKGGSTFNALERLPHTVGNVCDLDLAHAVRALNAIENELIRRERLVSDEHVARFDQLRVVPPRLVVVIDEFHALRDRLPDYMQRLNRLASLGRSLGMHLIVCTQNPMGQVHGDMKANIALNICLRVTDPMQSSELVGTRDAASIPPGMPGAAYCNDGQHTVPFLCSAVRDVHLMVREITTAARFHGCAPAEPLFSDPLARNVKRSDLSNAKRKSRYDIPIGLGDDGVLVSPACLDVGQRNIVVVGAYGSGKTNLLLHCARWLYEERCCSVRFTRKTDDGFITDDEAPSHTSSNHARVIWLVDDADELLSPFNTSEEAARLTEALADPGITVMLAVEKASSTVLERCPTRIVFPTGERANDLMIGVPGTLLDGFSARDYTTVGRGVFVRQAQAFPVQCARFEGFSRP